MGRFLLRLVLFATPLIAAVYAICLRADGRTDAYYLRFTTPRTGSLITGTSRAAQGIRPDILLAELSDPGPVSDLYNFSFTLSHTPYGPAYLDLIGRKLDRTRRNGAHFVAVDPWSLAADKEAPDDAGRFVEKGMFADKLHTVSSTPNLEYLLTCYPEPLLDLVIKPAQPGSAWIHANGWLDVRGGLTRAQQLERAKVRLAEFRGKAAGLAPSRVRTAALVRTVQLLQGTGDVFLVRMPIARELLALEDTLMPRFDDRMRIIAEHTGARYIAFTDSLDRYTYTDGNHVDQPSAARVSAQLGRIVEATRTGR